MKINLIDLGFGKFVVTPGFFGESAALFIERAPIPDKVGAPADDSGLRQDAIADGSTVITFDNFASVDVMAEELNKVKGFIGQRRGKRS